MIPVTAGYLAVTNGHGKTPIYHVILMPVGEPVGATEPRYDFISEVSPLAALNAPEGLVPISFRRETDPEHSRFGSLSTLTFQIQDFDGQVTEIVNTLVGYEVYFKMAYWENADYVTFASLIITDIRLVDRTYTFTARSKFAAAHDKIIFNGATTRLIDAVTDSDTTFHVEDASDFETASISPGESEAFQVGPRHIYAYRAIEDVGDGTWNLAMVIRSAGFGYFVPPELPDVPEAHTANSTIKNIITMGTLSAATSLTGVNDGSMHPIEIMRRVLTNETGKRGIAESKIKINNTQLIAAAAELGNNLQFRFAYEEGVSVKNFLEKEIYLPLAAYPTENNAGEIGMKLFGTAHSSVDTVTDDDIVQRATWEGTAAKRINTVIYKYDYVPTTKEYTSTYTYRDEELIAAAGREIPLIIESKGIRSPLVVGISEWFTETPAFLEAAAQRHIARFGVSAPIIGVRTLWNKHLLEVADDVGTTFEDVINPITGTIGLSDAPAEVISINMNFQTNVIDMKLLGIPPIQIGFTEEEYMAITSTPDVT